VRPLPAIPAVLILVILVLGLAGCRVEVNPAVELPGKILYTAEVDGMSQVILNTPQGDEAEVITDSGLLRNVTGFYEPHPVPGGEAIVCVAAVQGFREICLIELTDPPTAKLLTEEGSYKADPVVSHDGFYVYYVSTSILGDDEIYRLELDNPRKELERLTDRRSDDSEPIISSDGNDLVFISDQNGSMDLYNIDLTGEEEPRRLTDMDGDINAPCFDAESDYILFDVLSEGNLDIGYVRLTSTNSGTLIETPDWMEYCPAISASGDYIMVISNLDKQVDICLYTWYGEFVRRVTDDEVREYDLVWYW
jgi:hypothetical protein